MYRRRVFLYPVEAHGIPLEQAVQARDKYAIHVDSISFLFSAYEPHVWWFELFETARRLLLTGFLVLFQPGTASQISVGMIVSAVRE